MTSKEFIEFMNSTDYMDFATDARERIAILR